MPIMDVHNAYAEYVFTHTSYMKITKVIFLNRLTFPKNPN